MFLSIVIPVYNAVKEIRRCLESIWQQGLSNDEYEVICVDDCSTDDSCSVIEGEMARHANLRLVRNETNLRAGGARNHGVQESKGMYIQFIDADDYFHPSALREGIKLLQSHPVDILVFPFIRELEGFPRTIPLHLYDNDEVYSPEEYRIHHGFIPYSPWQWIFKKSLMLEHGIWFSEKVCAEDLDWTHHLAHYANTMRCASFPLIHYVISSKSQTALAAHSSTTAYHALMAAERLQKVGQLWEKPENRQYIHNVCISYLEAGVKNYLFFLDSVKNKVDYLRKYLKSEFDLSFPWCIAHSFPVIYSLLTNMLFPIAVPIFWLRSRFTYRGIRK